MPIGTCQSAGSANLYYKVSECDATIGVSYSIWTDSECTTTLYRAFLMPSADANPAYCYAPGRVLAENSNYRYINA